MTTKSDFVARKNEIAILEVKVKFVFLSNSMYVLVFRFNNTQKYSTRAFCIPMRFARSKLPAVMCGWEFTVFPGILRSKNRKRMLSL